MRIKEELGDEGDTRAALAGCAVACLPNRFLDSLDMRTPAGTIPAQCHALA